MSNLMVKIKEDYVMSTYVEWALNPALGELREMSKHMVMGYALCLVSRGEISAKEYSQILHEMENVKNGEEG